VVPRKVRIVDARVVLHQPTKLALNAGMGFVDTPAGFEDQGLRRMKPGHIGGFVAIDAEDIAGLIEQFARLFKEGVALALHKSMPSARIA
jgi:hypothetical protein